MPDGDPRQLLPEIDREYLEGNGYKYEVVQHKNLLHVIFKEFQLPEAYDPRTVDLMVILPAGYPNANPDMFFTRPDVKLRNGAWPHRSDQHPAHAGQQWQQWSRHFPPGKWRAGRDSLRNYMGAVRRELRKGV